MGSMNICFDTFRQAAGMDVSSYYQSRLDAPRVQLANADPAENRHVREQLVDVLAKEEGVPREYVESVRQELGLDGNSDVASQPLDARDVDRIISQAEMMVFSSKLSILGVLNRLVALTTPKAKQVLSKAIDSDLDSLKTRMSNMGKSLDGARHERFSTFMDEAVNRISKSASNMKNILGNAGENEGAIVDIAVNRYVKELRAIGALCYRAVTEQDFDFNAIDWPEPLDCSDVYEEGTEILKRVLKDSKHASQMPIVNQQLRRHEMKLDADHVRAAITEAHEEWMDNPKGSDEVETILSNLAAARKRVDNAATTQTAQTVNDLDPKMVEAAALAGLGVKDLLAMKPGSVTAVGVALLTGTVLSIAQSHSWDECAEIRASYTGARRRASILTGINQRELRV